jgi:hypothetical protein
VGTRDTGVAERPFAIELKPNLTSIELVRLCAVGKLDMLLCTIGDGSRSPTISGVPSLLGLLGRLKAGGDTGDWSARWASSGGAWNRGFAADGFTGALCGRVGSRLEDASARTVEVDDEDVEDSRTVESPGTEPVLEVSASLSRDTGILPCNGLTCLTRVEVFDNGCPGEYDVIDVAVDEILKAPGDSE